MAISSDATITLSLIAKDLASGSIQKVATGLDGLKTKGSLAGTALKGAGMLASGGFAAMTAGALQAQDAQGKFMAATGGSRDAAKQFVSSMDGLAGSAGAVGLSFDTIAQAGIDVQNQFGTTGQQTQDLTGYFLDFAKASNQDVHGAILGLNDTLTAYDIPLQDTKGYMDELILSHQKFGTDIGPQTISTLQSISPALKTLGGDLQDGIGLMNAFETAGLDAGTAQRGLNTALQNVPPGTTLDDIITKLGSIQDPADRAKEAIKLFGSRAGAALAQVIKPGMTSLDDFKVSMDDAKGATQKAADDMQTDADKIRGVMDKIVAGAREVGQDFGPAITGLASLGSLVAPFAGGMKDLLAKVAAEVLPVATAEGTAVGGAISAGIAAGILTVGVAVIAAAEIKAIQDAKNQINSNPASIDGPDLFDARAPMWARAKVSAAQQMQALGQASLDAFNKAWDAGIASGMGPNDPALLNSARQAGLAVSGVFEHDSRPAFQAAGEAAGATIATGFDNAHDSFRNAANTAASITADTFSHDSRSSFAAAGDQAAAETALAFRKGMVANEGQAEQAFKDFMTGKPLNTFKELARLEGDLASKKLNDGLRSNDPLQRQWAEDTRNTIQSRIDDLKKLLGEDGSTASDNLQTGLNSNTPQIKTNMRNLVSSINSILNGIDTNVRINVNASRIAKNLPHFAAGGRYEAGTLAVVGDAGKPELFASDQSGYIFPNVPSRTDAGGRDLRVHLHLESIVPPSLAQMQAAARAFMPELTREIRRQRLAF